MGSADQQLKDGCNTNPVSLYCSACTGQIDLCFLGETAQDTNGPYISQCSSLPPFEGIYTSHCNHCRRKAEAREKCTSNTNAGLGFLENWLGPIELNGKKNYVSLSILL